MFGAKSLILKMTAFSNSLVFCIFQYAVTSTWLLKFINSFHVHLQKTLPRPHNVLHSGSTGMQCTIPVLKGLTG